MAKSQDPVQSLLVFFKLLFELVHDLAKDFKGPDFAASLHGHLDIRENRAKLYTDLSEKFKLMPASVRGAFLTDVLDLNTVLHSARML